MIEQFPETLRANAVRTASEAEALFSDMRRSQSPTVVIIGRSIPGLLTAAGLSARGHRVVLVSGAPLPERRLVNGCTLRYAPLSCIADLLQVSVAQLADRLGGQAGTFHGFAVGREARGAVHPGTNVMVGTTQEPGGVSTRHGNIIATLSSLLPDFGRLQVIAGEVQADAELSAAGLPLDIGGQRVSLPTGNVVILNATPNRYLLRPNAAKKVADNFVYAVQFALRGKAPWGGDSALGLVREGQRIAHQLFFAPFADPACPQANYYLFSGTAFSKETLDRIGKEKLMAEIDGGLAVAERFGFSQIDAQETRASALIPYFNHQAVEVDRELGSDLPLVDINSAFTSGAPGVALDGMAAQAAGAHAFVRGFAAGGSDPVTRARAALVAADKKMAGTRSLNRTNVWMYYRAPSWFRATLFATTTQASLNFLNRYGNNLGAATPLEQTHTGVLYALGRNLWTLRALQPFGLSTFSSRMTVVRLKEGVLLHSPVFLTPEHVAAINALGPVRFIVAPSLFHHRALVAVRELFPEARVFVPPGFAEKLPAQAPGTTPLDDSTPIAPEELSQVSMRGHAINETIFLHRESRTLLVTDLAYNIGKETQGSEAMWFRLFGVYGGGPVPRYNRKLISDPAEFRAAWEKVLALDFDRASVAHGRIIDEDAKARLASQWQAALPALLTQASPVS